MNFFPRLDRYFQDSTISMYIGSRNDFVLASVTKRSFFLYLHATYLWCDVPVSFISIVSYILLQLGQIFRTTDTFLLYFKQIYTLTDFSRKRMNNVYIDNPSAHNINCTHVIATLINLNVRLSIAFIIPLASVDYRSLCIY